MTISINAKPGNSAEISIIGEIKSDAAATFDQQLKALGKVRRIDLHIHSGGGNLFAALSIFNALKRHPARVIARIDGIAASAASFIAMAADEVRISANGQFMIHEAASAVQGGSGDMARTAKLLENLNDTMVGAYAEKSGLSRKKIAEMMAQETWMAADEALKAGFVDAIDEPVAIAAIDLSGMGFKHVPTPQTIGEYARTYWAEQRKPAEDSSAQAHVESTVSDLIVTDFNAADYWAEWNTISPKAKAQRGLK